MQELKNSDYYTQLLNIILHHSRAKAQYHIPSFEWEFGISPNSANVISRELCILPWPISVTHAIITTGHPIFIICQNMLCCYQRDSSYYNMPHAIINTIHAIINNIYTIIIYPMLLLTIWCYYQPTHASISKTYSIIGHLIFRHLNNLYYYQTHHLLIRHLCYYQTNHIIIKQLTLLSNTSYYYQHLNLLFLQFIWYHYYH